MCWSMASDAVLMVREVGVVRDTVFHVFKVLNDDVPVHDIYPLTGEPRSVGHELTS